MGNGLSSIPAVNVYFLALWDACRSSIYGSIFLDIPVDDGDMMRRMECSLTAWKTLMRHIILQATSDPVVHIDPVYDARPHGAVNAGQFKAAVVHQEH